MPLVKSLAQTLEAEQARKTAEESDLRAIADTMRQSNKAEVTKKLSTHIDIVWKQLVEDNRQQRLETVALLTRSRGEYEPDKLANIKLFKGSEAFIRSGEQKCRSAFSWLTDIYRGENDLPWALEPSAVPSLPGETKEAIKEEIMLRGNELEVQLAQEAEASGQPLDPAVITKTMNDWQLVAEQEAVKQITQESKTRCAASEKQIRDDNQEGGWDKAFKDFLWYFIRCKCGIIKGPILTKKTKPAWIIDPVTKKRAFGGEETIANDVYCVSPFNFYPTRGMTDINDGDVVELHELTRQSISDLIGVPGYEEAEVRLVLAKLHSGELKPRWLTIEDETQVKSVLFEKTPISGTTRSANPGDLLGTPIYAIEYYGTVPGRMLIEWMSDPTGIDPDQEYQANCWKIGENVIKAVVNPDILGRKPFHISSWAKSPTWILGEGLLEFAAVIEDILNAITRALVNNIAIASGPQVEVNSDRCDDKTVLYPWKRWSSTGSQMKDGPAVSFWQPEMHTGELIAAWEFFGKLLDEMTVPAYAQGAAQSGVTAGTATVFTQLLAAASRSIKAVAANIDDDIITPYTKMCYDNLMLHTKDEALKGDANVVAKGVAGLMAKEQEAQRKVEFLQVAANPVYAQTLGAKNIGYILSQIAKANNLQLPDQERLEGSVSLEDLLTKMNRTTAGIDPNQANGQMSSGGSPPAAQATTADGRAAGSPDMQQPAGIAQ